jgi:hypothetical protein
MSKRYGRVLAANARIIERLERAGFTLSLWGYAHRGSANGILPRPTG